MTVPDVLARVLDEDTIADPYPYLSWVRENHPVHQAKSGAYLLTRHADCMAVQLGGPFRMPDENQLPDMHAKAARHRSVWLLTKTMTMHNPPGHTRLRRLLSRDFTRRRMDALRAATEQICDELLCAVEEPLRDGEVVDLHGALSVPLPVRVISDLMGFPEQDRTWLFGKVPTVLGAIAPGASEEVLALADKENEAIEQYMIDLLARRSRDPKEDLATAWALSHAEDADRFTHDELISMLWGMLAGGLATTAAAISNGINHITRHPGQTHWLRDDAAKFVDESLRYESPSMVSGVPRYTAEDVELSGVPIPRGSEVRTMLAPANRDPAVFPDPDRFDPSRDTSKSLTFGHGIHHCLGFNLARMELTILLSALHRRFPDLRLAEAPHWRRSLPVRAIESLPATLN
ncbi:cytochrome P450 [Kibdelosporangium banguiense]|uniref:Cytochrome P450 n=1 Tax=Kibdelosporangium banguiense TaxID=1365924 RepID=A0ABS4TQI6_9PSEU|nr:cytochrome P450 [Kibdelosporangium banguiense]MBP2326668.1 cytochrome P450 [Kibdelosporangium banguiense]